MTKTKCRDLNLQLAQKRKRGKAIQPTNDKSCSKHKLLQWSFHPPRLSFFGALHFEGVSSLFISLAVKFIARDLLMFLFNLKREWVRTFFHVYDDNMEHTSCLAVKRLIISAIILSVDGFTIKNLCSFQLQEFCFQNVAMHPSCFLLLSETLYCMKWIKTHTKLTSRTNDFFKKVWNKSQIWLKTCSTFNLV